MNNALEYKGYLGSVEYSGADEMFFGRILGITDHITYEGDSVKALKRNFEEAVEEYFESCVELVKEPEQPNKGCFDVYVSPELHKQLVVFSAMRKQSINTIVEAAIRNYVT